MPEATLNAVADHGVIRGDTVRGSYGDAQRVLDDLATLGIDYEDVVTALEADGVERFQASWMDLLESVSAALGRLGASTSKAQ
jgi:transaldolase